MTPTEVLKREHTVVRLVLKAVERHLGFIESDKAVDEVAIGKMLYFFHGFVDKCHHAKEEKHLFPWIEQHERGEELGIDALLQEHEEGRRMVKAIGEMLAHAAQGECKAIEDLSKHLTTYVDLLDAHIEREEEELFPEVDDMQESDDSEMLVEAFEDIEVEETGEGVHEKYHQIAHELSEREPSASGAVPLKKTGGKKALKKAPAKKRVTKK